MRAVATLCAAFALALAVGSIGSADEFKPVDHVTVTPQVTVTENPPAPGEQPFKGETHSGGDLTSSLQAGANPSVSISVPVTIQINPNAVGQQYTDNQPGDCKGSTFALTRSYIEAHERAHVDQIRDKVQQYVRDNLKYNNTNGFSFAGAATGQADVQARVNKFAKQQIDELAKDDQAEYAAGSKFPPNSLEGRARAAACREFMARVGNQLEQMAHDAQDTMDDISTHMKMARNDATNAKKSAAAALDDAKKALEAAKKCDVKEFKKWLDKFLKDAKAAEDAAANAQASVDVANDGNHAGRLGPALAAYNAAKAAAGVTAFKKKQHTPSGDKGADAIMSGIGAFLTQLGKDSAAVGKDLHGVKDKLAAAKRLIDEAFGLLELCHEQGKIDDETHKTVLEEQKSYKEATKPKPSPPAPPTPTPPVEKPIDEDPHFKNVQPQPGDGSGTEGGVFLPPLAGRGPHSLVTGTVLAPDEKPGPKTYYLGVVDAQGHKLFFRGLTDAAGRLRFVLPRFIEGVVAVDLFRKFNRDGTPDAGARCLVANEPAHVADLQQLLHVPPRGPAVLEANSAVERGGNGQGLMALQTRGTDPLTSVVRLDGSTQYVDTLAASNESVLARVHDDAPLGVHRVTVRSSTGTTNAFATTVVTETFDRLPSLKPGQNATVTLHVGGLRPQDAAVVIFSVGGAARLVNGQPTATVPVVNGAASVDIRATNPGSLQIKTTLQVRSPDF